MYLDQRTTRTRARTTRTRAETSDELREKIDERRTAMKIDELRLMKMSDELRDELRLMKTSDELRDDDDGRDEDEAE
ncbi:unnamed protein product [Camellia sinensis]